MAADLISRKTRYEFREEMVGWVLREIEQAFNTADLEADRTYAPAERGARRSFVEQFYKNIDFANPDHVRSLLKVYADAIERRERYGHNGYSDPKAATERTEYLKKLLRRDGFEYAEGEIKWVSHNPALTAATIVAQKFDLAGLKRQVDLIHEKVESDPPLAIGTSKELVETVCRAILGDRKIEVEAAVDVTDLVGRVRKELKLMPEDIGEDDPAVKTLRSMLGALGSLADGIMRLRNRFGTGHGHHPKQKGLQPRHARLVAGSATTLAVFLWETHVARGGRSGG